MHGPGEFTGEINMLSARRSLVRARIADDGEVIVVDRDDLRTLVQRDSELSEILMRAFILRRVALMAEGTQRHGAARLAPLGGTQRIREFLTRNGQPFTYQDVETDPERAGAARSLSRSASTRCRWSSAAAATCCKNPSHRDAGLGARPERRPRSRRRCATW